MDLGVLDVVGSVALAVLSYVAPAAKRWLAVNAREKKMRLIAGVAKDVLEYTVLQKGVSPEVAALSQDAIDKMIERLSAEGIKVQKAPVAAREMAARALAGARVPVAQ